jgi:hypothetical protein
MKANEKILVGVLSALTISPYITEYYLKKQLDPLTKDFLSQYQAQLKDVEGKEKARLYKAIKQDIQRNFGTGSAEVVLSNQDNAGKGEELEFKANQAHFIWFYDQNSIKKNGQPLQPPMRFEPYDDKYYDQKLVIANDIAHRVGLYSLLGLALWFMYTGLRGRPFLQRLPFMRAGKSMKNEGTYQQ